MSRLQLMLPSIPELSRAEFVLTIAKLNIELEVQKEKTKQEQEKTKRAHFFAGLP